VLSISLELPEFEVIKQLSFSNQYFVHVQKSVMRNVVLIVDL